MKFSRLQHATGSTVGTDSRGEALREDAETETRVVSALLALGVTNRVTACMRQTVELVFLDIGTCPDIEVKDRKELRQGDWEERGAYCALKQAGLGEGTDVRELTLGNYHTMACLYTWTETTR